MDKLDEKIQSVLNVEADIPDIVNDKARIAFSKIMASNETTENVIKSKHHYGKKAAAVALIAIMAMGTTTFAAGKYLGLFDYFSEHGQNMPKEATNMINTDVVQDNIEEGIVDFKVREAVCDSHQIYVLIEAKPADPNKYLIVSQDTLEDDPIEDLGIISEIGTTVGEYAASQNKELLYTGVNIQTGADSLSIDFQLEEDGTGIFIVSSENVIETTEMNLNCITTVLPANSKGTMDDIIRNEFTFTLQDISTAETLIYQPVGNTTMDGTGLAIDKIEFTKTELGLYGKFTYYIADNATETQKNDAFNIDFHIYDENGTELKGGIGENSGIIEISEGVYQIKRCYSLAELPENLVLKAHDWNIGEELGTLDLQLVK